MKRLIVFLTAFLASSFFITSATIQAQWSLSNVEELTRAHIGEAEFRISDFSVNPGSQEITFTAIVRSGIKDQSQTFRLNYAVNPNTDPGWQAYYNWIDRSLRSESLFSTSQGFVLTTSHPIASNVVKAFKNQVFPEQIESRMEKAEKEKEESMGMIKTNEIISDIEYESFNFAGDRGGEFAMTAGYTRIYPDINLEWGGYYYFHHLSFEDQDDNLKNSILSFAAKKKVVEKGNSIYSIGINFDYMLFDKNFNDNNRIGFGAYFSGKHEVGDHVFVWGSMYQHQLSKIEKFHAHYWSNGFMYSVPLGQRLVFTVDTFGTYIMSMSYGGNSMAIDGPFMLTTGGYLEIFISRAFGINTGVKTTLLAENYDSVEYALGVGVRF